MNWRANHYFFAWYKCNGSNPCSFPFLCHWKQHPFRIAQCLVWTLCKASASISPIDIACPKSNMFGCQDHRRRCKCSNPLSLTLEIFISASFSSSVSNRHHKAQSPKAPCQSRNRMSRPGNSAYSEHLTAHLFMLKKKDTFKFWWIVFVFVFQLHIFNHYLRKVRACYLMVPFLVHVFSKGRVA